MLPGDPVSPQSPRFPGSFSPILALVVAGVLAMWMCGCSDNETIPPAPNEPDVRGLADLVITSGAITATPTTVSAGGNVEMSAGTIQNVGQSLQPLTLLQNGFYLSTDANITSSDVYLGAAVGPIIPIGPINIDLYKWETDSVQIPPGTSPGSYYIGVLVDRLNSVHESDETNNAVATPITVEP